LLHSLTDYERWSFQSCSAHTQCIISLDTLTEQLIYASGDGDMSNVTKLLGSGVNGANVNGRLNDGSTALQYAARDGQLKIAEVGSSIGDLTF
jgi:hypothetical protein